MPNSTPSPSFPETLTLVLRTPLERLLVERALVMAQELEALSEQAEAGRVLDCCEEAAVAQGRAFTRSALEAALQAYVDRQEKKRPTEPVTAVDAEKTREWTPKRR